MYYAKTAIFSYQQTKFKYENISLLVNCIIALEMAKFRCSLILTLRANKSKHLCVALQFFPINL